jgi:peptidoglycan/LPS O-acetylase OafA/YrhL
VSERDRYFDLIRGLALVRVVIYHALALAWMHTDLPVMGVMFALAGSLMYASFERRPGRRVVLDRLRRLLPPFWLFAAVTLVVGLEIGDPGRPIWAWLPFWLLPLRDPSSLPPGSELVDTLWYLRTYLWFVLCAPIIYRLLRRMPSLVLPAPVFLLSVLTVMAAVRWPDGALTDFVGYGALFLLGFADRCGAIRRLPGRLRALLIGVLAAAGLLLRLVPDTTPVALDDVSTVAYFLLSAAVVLLVLSARPKLAWLRESGWAGRAVTIVNARAMSIYLWHDPAIAVVRRAFARWGVPQGGLLELAAVVVLTAVAAIAFGWAEDLAARRRPAFIRRIGVVGAPPVGRHRREQTGRGRRVVARPAPV